MQTKQSQSAYLQAALREVVSRNSVQVSQTYQQAVITTLHYKRGTNSQNKNASGVTGTNQPLASAGAFPAFEVSTDCCRLVLLGVPLSAQAILSFSSTLVSMAFIGHLGKHELSAAVLGTSLFNVTGLSILIGLCSAMETLCGQVLLPLSIQYVCLCT